MIDPAHSIDSQLRHARQHMVGGGDAVWGLSPAELMERDEERDDAELAERERLALREEIFNALLEYLFADGFEPWHVSANVRAFVLAAHEFAPSIELEQLVQKFLHCSADEGDFWVDPGEVVNELRGGKYPIKFRAQGDSRDALSLCTWFEELREERDRDTVATALRSLAVLIFCEGCRPRALVSVCYCLAKTLKPELIVGMSLHSIAVMCGDNGRATVQARCERIYSALLARNGAKATRYAHQKSATAAEVSRRAQLGNNNRTKNFHPKKKRK